MSDAELLAIFLRTGVNGLSAVDLSRKLLNQFGSLRSLLGALANGHKQLGPDFLEAGDQVLDALELGSRFGWELSHADLCGAIAGLPPWRTAPAPTAPCDGPGAP